MRKTLFGPSFPQSVLALTNNFGISFEENSQFKGSEFASSDTLVKEGIQLTDFASASFNLLNTKSTAINKLFMQEKASLDKAKDKSSSNKYESETTQARCSSFCSSQVSRNSSPKLSPSSILESSEVSKHRHKAQTNYKQKDLVSIHPRKKKIAWKKQASICIEILIRAVEEDLGRSAKKCGNVCCSAIQQLGIDPKLNERTLVSRSEWLCDICVQAYDCHQYCEFCYQLYLNATDDTAALDGKEWAQCEAVDGCGRWAHVECLAKALGRTRDMVVAESFKYVCCDCEKKCAKKRKAAPNKKWLKKNSKRRESLRQKKKKRMKAE